MLEQRIRALERDARPLEPLAENRARLRDAVVAHSEAFLDDIDDRAAFDERSTPGDAWRALDIDEQPENLDSVLRSIDALVDRPGLNPASAGHMGYIPGGGLYAAALGDFLAAVSNRYAGVSFPSPGAVRMENALIRWMARLVGFPESTAGNLASGGSIANLIGVVCARDAAGILGDDCRQAVIYTTAHAHHCLDKAYRIAGVGMCVRREVPMDSCYRMDAGALEAAVCKDRGNGLRPWMIVASAGTTDVGAIDPLDEIGEIARRQGLWFHLDAAYGGFFVLTDEGRRKLRGIECCDSLVMDPHKGLFLPYGLGAVLIRDRCRLRESFRYQAAYMQDAAAIGDLDSPADLSPELSKHFRGLRMWLPLKLHGVGPFRAGLEEKLLLTRYAAAQLRAMPGFEVLHEPDLSVVAFRYVPRSGDPNEFNLRLRSRVQRDGRVFLSSTTLNGIIALRFAILSFRTHLDRVQTALQVLKASAEQLEREPAGPGPSSDCG